MTSLFQYFHVSNQRFDFGFQPRLIGPQLDALGFVILTLSLPLQ
jgi:hypothetical protein